MRVVACMCNLHVPIGTCVQYFIYVLLRDGMIQYFTKHDIILYVQYVRTMIRDTIRT